MKLTELIDKLSEIRKEIGGEALVKIIDQENGWISTVKNISFESNKLGATVWLEKEED